MNFYILLKVFADISLYFGCIGAFPGLFSCSFFWLWPAIVCSASAAIAAFLSDHGRRNYRFGLMIATLSPLLLCSTLMDYLILMPMVIYTSFLIFRDEWSMEYFTFRDGFRKNLTIFGIGLAVIHCGVLIEGRMERSHVLDSIPMLRQLVLYAISGIILQRQLRLGKENSRSWRLNGIQLILTALILTVFLLGIVSAERFLSIRGFSLGQLMGHAIQYLLAIPMAMLRSLFVTLAELIRTAQSLRQENSANTDIDPIAAMPMEQMQQMVEHIPEEDRPFPWWFAIAFLIVMTAVLILSTRVLRKRSPHPQRLETIAKLAPEPKENTLPRRSNRSKLRKIYREFLKAERRKGQKIQPWHTTQDIQDSLRPGGNAHAAAKLRSLYLSARYDLNRDVSADQVQDAKDALNQYRK